MIGNTKRKKEKKKTTPAKTKPGNRKSVAVFFGINKAEEDGLKYQKKVRNEWN